MITNVTDVLIGAAAKVRDAHPDDNVAIVVGSSSQAMHRVVGSVAINPGAARTGTPRDRALIEQRDLPSCSP